MRSLVALLLAFGCAEPRPIAVRAPEPEVTDAAPKPPEPATAEPVVHEDEGEWLDSVYVGIDPNPACHRMADCWHAPKQKPSEAAPAPFDACGAIVRNTALDPDETKKARVNLANDACCYVGRVCKLPLAKP